MARATPIPTIGPISGEISMAPIITAVELTFRPIDAMNIAHAKIQRLAPLNEMFFKTSCRTFSCFSSPSCKLNKLCCFILFIFRYLYFLCWLLLFVVMKVLNPLFHCL